MKFGILVVIFLILITDVYSQQLNNIIKGTVKDSVTGKSIPSATVTIYMGGDSLVLNYAFTNNSGNFKFEALPFDTTLLIVVSHLGYNPFRRNFRLIKSAPELALSSILMSESNNVLKEVTVSVQKPPIFMQGDTLVVNPGAFKTKANAVVEDVLRKVPGIVVWADGKISVNGKYVSKLLVAGKPFFGGDPVVAIRNLPKEAIDKIKIYEDKGVNNETETDAKLIMDIKLRNGLKAGFFGKGGGSVGTDKRSEGNLAMNVFTPKNQFSVMAVTNNTNKEIFDVRSMLHQTVYKAGGNDNTGYQSNFGMPGLNSFKAGGLNFERRWTKTVSSKVEYFRNDIGNETEKNISQITKLDNGDLNKQIQESSKTIRQSQFLRTFFKDFKPNYEFTFEPLLENQKISDNLSNQIHTDKNGIPVSTNFSLNNSVLDEKKVNINTEYIRRDKISSNQKYWLRYTLYADDHVSDELLQTTFSNQSSPVGSDIDIDRKKKLAKKITNQSLSGDFDLNAILKIRGRLRYKLTNTINHITQESNQRVDRFNIATNNYSIKDEFLSNQSDYRLIQERPGLEVSAGKIIDGIRDKKQLSLAALSEMQYISQTNGSQKVFQQINRDYMSFLPSIYFRFNHIKEGKFNKSYLLKYTTRIEVPTIEQLAPLTDSANQYYINIGNSQLKRQYSNEVSFRYQNYIKNNAASFGFEVKIGQTGQKLVDSSLFDNAGRQTNYTINANGHRYLNASLSYEQSITLFKNPLGLKVFPKVDVSNNPYYINGKFSLSKNLGASVVGMINYVQNDLLLYDLITNVIFYRNAIDDRKLQSAYISTGGNIQLSWPKHTTIVNSLGYTINTSSQRESVDYLTWNANVYYRLLKSEQLELKLTATDLLRQRTNVIRNLDNYVLSNGIVNNLQQFFMIGISYYPRYFGLKKVK